MWYRFIIYYIQQIAAVFEQFAIVYSGHTGVCHPEAGLNFGRGHGQKDWNSSRPRVML